MITLAMLFETLEFFRMLRFKIVTYDKVCLRSYLQLLFRNGNKNFHRLIRERLQNNRKKSTTEFFIYALFRDIFLLEILNFRHLNRGESERAPLLCG